MTGSNHNVIGYWACQEQFSMQDLLKFVVESERGGLKISWWHDMKFV